MNILHDDSELFESDFVTISYNSEYHYILVIWKKFATNEEQILFRENLLDMIKRTKAKAYLTDNRKLAGATEKIQYWIRDNWFPAAYEAGLRIVASVQTSDRYAGFAINTILEGETLQKMNIQQFKKLSDAHNWIIEQIKSI